MSSYNSQRPPPLPPRSPIPAPNTSPSPATYQSWSYPPPPPGPPPRSSGPSPVTISQPPPIPPRPPGFEAKTGETLSNASASPQPAACPSASPNGQAYTSFQLPPPPPGPPPRSTLGSKPPLPPRPQQNHGSGASSPCASTPPALGPGAQSPGFLTSFPPPPPGPPPRTSSSPSPYSPAAAQQDQPALPSPAVTCDKSDGHTQPIYSPAALELPSPAAAAFGFPTEPPPPYTPSLDTSTTPLSEKTSGSSMVSPSVPAPVSNPQSPNELSFFPPPPAISPQSTQSLQTSFQSLNIKPPPKPPKPPKPMLHVESPPTSDFKANSVSPSQPATHNLTVFPTPQSLYALPTETSCTSHVSLSSKDESAARAVTSCLDTPVTFATEWYWHPDTPKFLMCSRCYVDHVHETRFRDSFISERPDDGRPRRCHFSKPRMRDHLFQAAIASGSLHSALDWMRFRTTIPDCRGVEGVKGDLGIKWYKSKFNDMPGFVCCQACYEDHLMNNQFASLFAPAPAQPAKDVWACDMAIPFVLKECESKGETNDWIGFATRAKARMSAKPCPGRGKAFTYGRSWFIPKNGPDELALCAACYYDQVMHTGEESKWQVAEGLSRATNNEIRCGMGVFSIKIAMARAHETKDFSTFWTAVDKLGREKFCDDAGIKDGTWYTLPSNPADFGICAGCYVAILEPLNVSQFFVRRTNVAPGITLRCGFSLAHPRLMHFMPRLLEMYFKLDPTSFDSYVSVYAGIPPCPREADAQNKRWYGWQDCTICPECYHEFAHHSPLADMMKLKNAPLETSRMCEMYSKRMRALYTQCSTSDPPDTNPLLEYSAQRRLVYMDTVPQIRMILAKQQQAVNQQQLLNTVSTHYNMSGQQQQILYGTTQTYSAPGVGSGFANYDMLQGAAYGQQAMGIAASMGGGNTVLVVQQLEQRWRAVE